MAKIQVLDQHTVNQIAAGEVIERPASVVKELLENAIDAKATAVTVEIKDGGTSLIRITDNGSGISREEVPLAFLPHATSKIARAEDLLTVSSLGFRGEALASIASVSQVEVITKTSRALTGTRYEIEGGVEKTNEEVGAPEGTTFLIRNLFYNTPARRKFLRTPATEASHISDLIERVALSRPDVSIRFINNNQNKLHTSGNHNIRDIIYTIYGKEIASNLVAVKAENAIIQIDGYVGKPVIARGNRNFENYFINGRYIKSGLIYKAIEEAFSPYMMNHKYPFTALYFTIDPSFMDVNVHPTKMELRFREGESIFAAIHEGIKGALSQKELIPQVSLKERRREQKLDAALRKPRIPEPFEKQRMREEGYSLPKSSFLDNLVKEEAPVYPAPQKEGASLAARAGSSHRSLSDLVAADTDRNPVQKQIRQSDLGLIKKQGLREEIRAGEEAAPAFQAAKSAPEEGEGLTPTQGVLPREVLLSEAARSKHQLIGQLFGTYWLIEYEEQLFIIDQHAAHEKVLYEKTMAAMKDRVHTSQLLSPPIILTLSMSEENLLNKYLDAFTGIGFEIEPFGGKEYAIRAVPGNLFSIAKKELLMELLDGLSEDMGAKDSVLIQEKVASLSCKAAVKGNHQMSAAEADHLIDQLLELENPYACPHGRPTIIAMSKYEIEKKFKRIL